MKGLFRNNAGEWRYAGNNKSYGVYECIAAGSSKATAMLIVDDDTESECHNVVYFDYVIAGPIAGCLSETEKVLIEKAIEEYERNNKEPIFHVKETIFNGTSTIDSIYSKILKTICDVCVGNPIALSNFASFLMERYKEIDWSDSTQYTYYITANGTNIKWDTDSIIKNIGVPPVADDILTEIYRHIPERYFKITFVPNGDTNFIELEQDNAFERLEHSKKIIQWYLETNEEVMKDEKGLKDVEEIKKDIQYLATLMGKEEQKNV